jgi:hypothetical protein
MSTAELTPPDFVAQLLGWRNSKSGGVVPNIADSANPASRNISTAILEHYGVGRDAPPPPSNAGRELELATAGWLRVELEQRAPHRRWEVLPKGVAWDFAQYEHLRRLQDLIEMDTGGTLRVEVGGDYVIRPDITVGLQTEYARLLHASVSCKWTIRSDRVQNIRHEAVVLTRSRRGRQPHIVAVTCEPMPSRIKSIAQGTGEVDAVYHLALDALTAAVHEHGSPEQVDALELLVGQGRLFDIAMLPAVIAE